MRYELIMWLMALVKSIPGNTGCVIRNLCLPYKRGVNVKVWNGVQIDSPSKLFMGNNESINRNCILHAGGSIRIGNDVLIGPNVVIYSQNHVFNTPKVLIRKQGYKLKSVKIGSNVWIAANSIILPGVEIGSNIVLGANSVVSRSIEKLRVYAGNPLKFIKPISD